MVLRKITQLTLLFSIAVVSYALNEGIISHLCPRTGLKGE
jgi:hypothetical protein